MKSILITFAVLVLTVVSSYCQKTYPNKLIIDNDTVVAITVDQLREINVVYERLNQCGEENDYLNKKVFLMDEIIANTDGLATLYELENDNLKKIVVNKQREIEINRKKVNELSMELDSEVKKNKLIKPILSTSIALNIVLILILL